MPRVARASVGGLCYHVINRGNDRREIFLKDGDYQAFLKAMAHACIEIPMPVLAYCLMPNHFHMVVAQRGRGLESLDALGPEYACPSLPSALSPERAHMARPFQ